jgi:hypothetical protein
MTGPQEVKLRAGARVGVPSHEKPCSTPLKKRAPIDEEEEASWGQTNYCIF